MTITDKIKKVQDEINDLINKQVSLLETSQSNQTIKMENALKEIRDICNQINITIMGGEKSPKEEWINLYLATTAKILSICKEVLC